MISLQGRRIIILIFTGMLMLLMILGLAYVITHGSVRQVAHATPTAASEPGLVVYGYVRDSSGAGVKGVEIYRSYASYPGEIIARTDKDGYYQSEFHAIPGDEMVTIWATRPGTSTQTEPVFWRHYHGYERVEQDFVVPLSWSIFFPFISK